MAGISSLGLGSGIDIRAIVDGLVAAERDPQEFQLTRQETNLQAKLSSYGIFKSGLSDFRASLAGLRDAGKFSVLQASSSNPDVISASVSSNADEGSFSFESKQLAQSQSLVSAGFGDAQTIVGTGTVTIKFGATDYDVATDTYNSFTQSATQGTLTIDLDASNNTLVGMRDAINSADAGVSASIIFDGTANRLVMVSENTGAENSMEITVSDPSLSAFEFNSSVTNMDQTQEAQDAILSINGLDVTNASNAFDKTLKGVTLDLKNTLPGQLIRVDISSSTDEIVGAMESFVEKFNEVASSVRELTRYNPASQTGSVLLGDSTLRTGMGQIRSVMSSLVSGLESSSIRTLVDLGMKTQADGTIEFDSAKLIEALAADPDGVAAVFTEIGRPSDDNVTYISNTDDTTTGDYAVNVTQAATQALYTGANNSVSSLVVNAGVNDTFKINVDGNFSSDITLTAGTYNSADELAVEIQAQINGDSTLRTKGAKVSVSYDSVNNNFLINSQAYGASSNIEITDSTATNVGLAVDVGTAGTDVAGTIGSNAANGDGQELTSSDGLKLLIEGGVSGSLGTVSFSRGLMEQLDFVLGGLLDSDGSLVAKTEGLQESLDLISDERLGLNDKIAKFEARLLSKFNAMDAILGQLSNTSASLTSQLASLPYNNLPRNR